MKKIIFILSVISYFNVVCVFSQSKKDIVKAKVLSRKEIRTDYSTGKPLEYIESEKIWDKAGNVIEEKKFNFKNALILHVKYSYNKANDIVTEQYFNSSGELIKKIEYDYLDNLKVAKRVFSKGNILKTKKVYTYEYRKDE